MKSTPSTISSHYMQSGEWADLRKAGGWETTELKLDAGIVRAYRKPTPLGGLVYVPGYMLQQPEQLAEIVQQLKTTNDLVCKIEPCEEYEEQVAHWFEEKGWRKARSVQYEFTVRLDLTQSEEELWRNMKARGRQEINYARQGGIVIEEVTTNHENLESMYQILQTTSRRKDFGIREKRITLNFWQTFAEARKLKLFFAKYDNKVIAGGVFITDGKNKVWYKDAGSMPGYHKLFGPRLLLWETALKFKKDGYKLFDLGGTANPANYENDPMKGVHIFKTAFAREVTAMMPAYELPLKPLLYPLWNTVEPAALKARRVLSTIKGKLLGRR